VRPIGTAKELELRRRRSVELVKNGEHVDDVARILGCGRSSIYTWLKLDREAPDELDARPHPGPTPLLTDQQIGELEALLLQGARAHGYHNDLWSASRVAEVIANHFGVSYHVEHVRKLIRKRLRWSSQKPQRKAKQRDEAAIAR
jgi:transposase